MESLEKFLETRMRQSQFQAMMIPRYLENPNRFIGKRTPTMEQAAMFEEDAGKCKKCLDILKEIQIKKRAENRRKKTP